MMEEWGKKEYWNDGRMGEMDQSKNKMTEREKNFRIMENLNNHFSSLLSFHFSISLKNVGKVYNL